MTNIIELAIDTSERPKKRASPTEVTVTVAADSEPESESGLEPEPKKRKGSPTTLTTAASTSNPKSLKAKREYNRMNAARFRQRRKELLDQLQSDLKATTALLQQERADNMKLKVQVAELLLEKKSRDLTTTTAASASAAGAHHLQGLLDATSAVQLRVAVPSEMRHQLPLNVLLQLQQQQKQQQNLNGAGAALGNLLRGKK